MRLMTRMTLVLVVWACIAGTSSSWGKTVGIWKDARSALNDGTIKTFSEAGWQPTILQGADLSDEAKLAGLSPKSSRSKLIT